jgi:5-methylcytosine-specific restriction endonuclease McrA
VGHGTSPGFRGAPDGLDPPPSGGLTMERVLLLNATYEPLALVSDRRAVVLVLAGRAEPVAFRDDCAVFHSASLDVDVPSIVRLAHMVRIPRWARTPPVTRRSVLRRDGGVCVYCSEPADTIDHVIPRSRGGTHEWSNVVAACKRDNLTKADLLLSELGWTLRVKPGPPDGYLWRLRHLSDVDPLWEPYLAAAS